MSKSVVDKGPWHHGVTQDGKRHFVQSEDFGHDVRLYIDGDFAGANDKERYAKGIATQLNAAPVETPAPAFSVGVHGVGVIDDNPSALAVYFNAAPNNDDIRALHEIVTNAPVAAQANKMPDAARIALDSLDADAVYLLSRVKQETMSMAEGAALIRQRIEAARTSIVAAQVQPSGDRAMLLELKAAFDGETWECPTCGHGEDTKDCDSAIMLREYLANNPVPAQAQQPVSGADGFDAWVKREYPHLGPIGDCVVIAREAWSAALAQQDAGKVDALERAVAGLKRYTYGYKDDGFGGPRYLGTIESPEGRLLIRDDVLSAIDAARKEKP